MIKIRYRPEIDGLRAVAVMAVVLYHAGIGCPGGYVGVDVFFVISGFLITSLIWQDLVSGKFTFANFWERRARRIVPALVVVTIVTLIVGWGILLPSDFIGLGKAAAAQAVFGANIYYWLDTGYFNGTAEEKPMLHTWSLAVEEQFYLFAPFLLWILFRFVKLRRRAVIIFTLLSGFVLSFVISAYGVIHFPSATFYLLPTRAWELLLGALIAFIPSSLLLHYRILRELFAVIGLALVLIPIFIYSQQTKFPGFAALPPCFGAALIIWSNERNGREFPTIIGAGLSFYPIVFIGLTSYSLYLWHWPLLAFSRYHELQAHSLSLSYRISILSLAFLIAVISWKYVETPFRLRKLGATRKSAFGFAGAGLITVLGGGLFCWSMQGFPERFPKQVLDFSNAASDMSFINEVSAEDVHAGKLVQLGTARDPTVRPAVLVWGDSHAMAALPAIDAFLKERGIAGCAATHSSTAPVLNWFMFTKLGLNRDAIAFNDEVFEYIRKQRISTVILSANWGSYARSNKSGFDAFGHSLLATIQRLVAINAHPWILLDVPNQSFDVPRGLIRTAVSHADIGLLLAKPALENTFDNINPKIIAEIEASGGRILDPKPKFLDPTGQYYIVQSNGIVLYRDEQHLTAKGSKVILLPLLREMMPLRRQLNLSER